MALLLNLQRAYHIFFKSVIFYYNKNFELIRKINIVARHLLSRLSIKLEIIYL